MKISNWYQIKKGLYLWPYHYLYR